VGKKTRQWFGGPSSVLLLTVGVISRSDGKIRSKLPSLNCAITAPVCFLFWLWLRFVAGPRPGPYHSTGQILWPRHNVDILA